MKIFLLFFFLIPKALSDITVYSLTPRKENRVKIAILDTGITRNEDILPYLCEDSHYDVTNEGIQDSHPSRHGTNISYLIAQQIDPAKNCIMIIKLFGGFHKGTVDEKLPAQALNIAIDNGAKFINLSFGGKQFIPSEEKAIKRAIANKIYVVVAAGNDGQQLKTDVTYFPACYNILSPYFRIVGNGMNQEHRHFSSNYGFIVTDWENGNNKCGGGICLSGTSQSCAITIGKLARKLTK